MNLKDYREQAILTNKWLHLSQQPVPPYSADFAHIAVGKMDFMHMIIGMGSELNELEDACRKEDYVNIAEELADIMWYTVNEASMHNIKLVHQTDVSTFTYSHLVTAISRHLDTMKKAVVYNKGVDLPTVQAELQTIANCCYNFSVNHSTIDLPVALERNIAKLRKRYPGNYNDYDANNRDLEAERKELEGN